MNGSLQEDVDSWVRPFLEREGLHEPIIEIHGGSEKGDGYLGDILFVTVRDKGDKKVYHLVIKCGKRSAKLRDQMPISNAFHNEIFVYNEVLPTFRRFQEEKGIGEPFHHYPRCYDTLVQGNIEIIILQNLKMVDYTLWDRREPMPRGHIEEVLRLYGKLHAISFAYRDQKPEEFANMAGKLRDMWREFKEAAGDVTGESFQQIINAATEKGETEIAEKAKVMNVLADHLSTWNEANNPYAIISHGDCWNNNFMFKQERGQLSDVSFLDWQLSMLASPVFDLSYFLFSCCAPEDLESFDQLVEIYYKSCAHFIRELGSDPDTLFPYEQLLEEWRKFGKFGVALMAPLLKICLSAQEEVCDLSSIAESDNTNITDSFKYNVKNVDEYARRAFAVMRLAMAKKFI